MATNVRAGARSPTSRPALIMLAAAVTCLLVTVVTGHLTRRALVEANAWEIHTDDVKLAIADCEHALDHGDVAALRRSESMVQQLTVDNARQQRNIAAAERLTAPLSRAALQDLLASMRGEEDRLMTERTRRTEDARESSSVAFVGAAGVTLLFGVGAFFMLLAQRHQLARHRALLEAIVESVDEGIIAVGPTRALIAMNAVARSMCGGAFPRGDWPKDWRPVLNATFPDGSPMGPEDGPLARAVRGEVSDGVVYCIRPPKDAVATHSGVWVSASARPIRDRKGNLIAAVTTMRDITEQRANADRLRDLSLTDELTGLFNRRGFHALANARILTGRPSKTPIALLCADVNGLKRINDELGHEQGDQTIQDTAAVLRRVFRDGDIVARIGGDEFVALLPNFAPSACAALLERLADAIRSHVVNEARPYDLSVSCGVTFMNWDVAQSLDGLLADADRKMYESKRVRAADRLPKLRVRATDGSTEQRQA